MMECFIFFKLGQLLEQKCNLKCVNYIMEGVFHLCDPHFILYLKYSFVIMCLYRTCFAGVNVRGDGRLGPCR